MGPMMRTAATILLALAAAAWQPAQAAQPTATACDWSQPGAARYTGTTAAALQRLAGHFTPAELAGLRTMIAARTWSDLVEIRRDTITGRARYLPQIEHMLFAGGRVCATVSRAGWADGQIERAQVYIAPGSTKGLILPSVCGNWAIVHRAPPLRAAAVDNGGPGPLMAGPDAPALAPLPAGDASGPGLRAAAWPIETPATFAQGAGLDAPSGMGPLQVMPSIGQFLALPSQPVLLPAPIPGVHEPGTLDLLLLGLAAAGAARLRANKRATARN